MAKPRLRHQAPRQSTLDGSYWETGMGSPQGSIAGGELYVLASIKYIKNMKEKINQKGFIKIPLLIVTIVSIVMTTGFGYGIFEYSKTAKVIEEAEQLIKAEKYNDAIVILETGFNQWTVENLGIKRQEIFNRIEEIKRLLVDKIKYNKGMEEFDKKNWDKAKESLSKVSKDSPYYQDAQNKIQESREMITEKQVAEVVERAVEETRQEMKNITKEIEKAREEAEDAKKIAEKDTQRKIEEEPKTDIVLLIEQWRSIIAYVECDFYYKGTDIKYLTAAGSGVLNKRDYKGYPILITNRHVVVDQEKYSPKVCRIKLPDRKDIISVPTENILESSKGYDVAKIWIGYHPYSGDYYSFDICTETPFIGEEIIILGYPAIGSSVGITATEGIISGYDGDYYITSAKVEHGNSGGAAILVSENCYLGIPTFAQIGSIESLSRILKPLSFWWQRE